jgi:hypothetical protein
MALTTAQRQARWKAKRNALAQSHPDAVEGALLEEAARCEQLSAEQRVALADQLADLASHHMWRARELAELARKVRPQLDPSCGLSSSPLGPTPLPVTLRT